MLKLLLIFDGNSFKAYDLCRQQQQQQQGSFDTCLATASHFQRSWLA